MKIGIVGTGSVGQALATGLSAADHEVVLGSREPDTARVGDVGVDTQQAAAAAGDIVILAVPGSVVVTVAEGLRDSLAGKTVVDPTNEYPTPSGDRALAERVAAAAPGAHIVKAFNTIGADHMTDPVIEDTAASMFLAGDDPDAVRTVETLAADLGFEPVVAGELTAAAYLEHLARLWIHLSREYGREIGFRLLRGDDGQE